MIDDITSGGDGVFVKQGFSDLEFRYGLQDRLFCGHILIGRLCLHDRKFCDFIDASGDPIMLSNHTFTETLIGDTTSQSLCLVIRITKADSFRKGDQFG